MCIFLEVDKKLQSQHQPCTQSNKKKTSNDNYPERIKCRQIRDKSKQYVFIYLYIVQRRKKICKTNYEKREKYKWKSPKKLKKWKISASHVVCTQAYIDSNCLFWYNFLNSLVDADLLTRFNLYILPLSSLWVVGRVLEFGNGGRFLMFLVPFGWPLFLGDIFWWWEAATGKSTKGGLCDCWLAFVPDEALLALL